MHEDSHFLQRCSLSSTGDSQGHRVSPHHKIPARTPGAYQAGSFVQHKQQQRTLSRPSSRSVSSGLSGMWPLSADARPCNASVARWLAPPACPAAALEAAASAAAAATSASSPPSGGLEKERCAAGPRSCVFCPLCSGATCRGRG